VKSSPMQGKIFDFVAVGGGGVDVVIP
jgi:hypothetical protein